MPFVKGQAGWNTRDFKGYRTGRLTVIRFVESRNKRRYWLCRCECGTEKQYASGDIRGGRLVSCGCYKNALTAERNRKSAKHGMTHTGVYRSWFAMRDRCENPKSPSWQWYGGRGIKVCEQWADFGSFFSDMGHRPEGMTIDRINTDGNYEPENCRWATPKEQSANQRGRNGN